MTATARTFSALTMGLLVLSSYGCVPVGSAPSDSGSGSTALVPGQLTALPGGAPAKGATITLTRFDNRFDIAVEAATLTPGNAYTLLLFLLNNPTMCDSGADGQPDCSNEAAGQSAILAGGAVADDEGSLSMIVTISIGDLGGVVLGPGLTNPADAEATIILRSHGPELPGQLEEQLGSIDGGCPPNECADALGVIFQP